MKFFAIQWMSFKPFPSKELTLFLIQGSWLMTIKGRDFSPLWNPYTPECFSSVKSLLLWLTLFWGNCLFGETGLLNCEDSLETGLLNCEDSLPLDVNLSPTNNKIQYLLNEYIEYQKIVPNEFILYQIWLINQLINQSIN